MKKKTLFASLAAISLLALSACSSSGSLDDDLVSMKGGSITVGDYYQEIKAGQSQTLQNMVIYKVFENAYGDKVTDEDVNEKYDEVAEQYDDFASVLEQNSLTEKTYKEQIKQQLAIQEGLEANVELTDEDLETAWAAYHPEVEAQIITAADEDAAKELLKKLDEGADFAELAKSDSTDTATAADGGTVKFDSTSTDIPTEVQTAAFDLENGKYSEVITSTDMNTYTTSYYIVKMVKNADKGDDMSKYEDKIKEIATDTKKNDSTFQNEVISKELKAANVKIKDEDFSDLLAGLMTEDSSTAETDASSTKESSSSTADSSAAESSTEESTSASE